ncbi:GNAT family N-acetyltransferase [Cumulibacter manganitolerans]|uniref:GNAT family N-acetyltransferase n=1 Tax=Cumulibacter manganitolerans TaxID=1884992 RepID=UPI001294B364|nr:GNAT family N-acetyltransferase [Cumulibacter manganitolerans]
MEQARTARAEDFDRVLRVIERHPVEACAVGAVLYPAGPHALRSGRLWMHGDAVCYSGANLLPVNADEQAARAFADLAIAEGRRCSSIVGRLPATAVLWEALRPAWGPARAVRDRQIVMVDEGPCRVTPDPAVRRALPADLGSFFAASVEMYLEEIGSSPTAHDGGASYRRRAMELIEDGVAFLRTDGDQVVFKAELGATTPRCAQLQGVWVHPDLRGRGIGTAGTAAVLSLARKCGVRRISLAVNDYNTPARHAYERCGFRAVAEQMVVLF